ncbi:hypothetical protein IIM_05051 [Bacillus cereus VD107]|nr:hypothetical protein IIM_05051 [Bacillus cereus VD107]
MVFRGKIILLVKDRYGCIHFYKKKSREPAELNQYIEYVQTLEERNDYNLIQSYVINKEDNSSKYIWCSHLLREEIDVKISANHQKYIEYLAMNRQDITFIGPYKSMKTKGLHLCFRGHEWRIAPNKVKKDGENCPNCKKKYKESNGAKLITELLIKHKITFTKELSLKTLGFEHDFRMDFVVCQNKYPLFVIEYNGIQHYKYMKSEYFGGFKGSRERMLRDKIKRNFCWGIGLPVIDIPYSETDEQIKETLLYFLNLYELI